MMRFTSIMFVLLLFAAAQPAMALDTIYRIGDEKRVIGEITAMNRTEVSVRAAGVGSGNVQTVPANMIDYIEWDGEPPAVKLARSQERTGQAALALQSYEDVLGSLAGKEGLRADVELAIARLTARLGSTNPERLADAVAKLKAWLDAYRDHYRFYNAQLLLAQTYLAQENYADAAAPLNSVGNAPFTDYKMAAKIARAEIELAQENVGEAKGLFSEVASMAATNPSEKAKQLAAKLGEAKCLQREGNHEEAVRAFEEVIDQAGPREASLQAEAYVREGDSYREMEGRTKDAIMAYLHVDVIPALSSNGSLHAEALYRLSQLWPTVGEATRAAEADARLEQLYPTSEWASGGR